MKLKYYLGSYVYIYDKISDIYLIMIRFRHPNLLEVMGYCHSNDVLALVSMYMINGSLYHQLHEVSCIYCTLYNIM